MTQLEGSMARAVADLGEGLILASVEVRATPERVFDALTSEEAITRWWVRPGVFDTRQWEGDVSVGGRWSASGVGAGIPYALEGEFLQVEAPRKLIHSWHGVRAPGTPTVVTYLVEPEKSRRRGSRCATSALPRVRRASTRASAGRRASRGLRSCLRQRRRWVTSSLEAGGRDATGDVAMTAVRVRRLRSERHAAAERRMVGGMCCGVTCSGPLAQPHRSS